MASKGKGDQSQLTTSLLLQPPRSGFSWNEISNNSILMPVSQVEQTSEGSGEVDSFIGQISNPSQSEEKSNTVLPQPGLQPLGSVQQQSAEAVPLSQLQQPLRLWQPKPSPTQSCPAMTYEQQHVTSVPASYSHPPQQPLSSQHPLTDCLSGTSTIPASPPLYSTASQLHTIPSASGLAPNFSHQDPMEYVSTVETDGKPSSPVPQNIPLYSPKYPVVEPNPSTAPSSSFSSATSEMPLSTSSYTDTVDSAYAPVEPHWFYRKIVETKEVWYPFSLFDSTNLEDAYKHDPNSVIATDGGRYDVHMTERLKKAVYWEEEPLPVRRCTWFYKPEGLHRFVPYDEAFSEELEEQYRITVSNNRWHQKVELSVSESVVMHNPKVILHFMPSNQPDEWGNVPEGHTKPRRAKRGINDVVEIKEGESTQIDHLVFVVHGIGTFCDLRFRSVVECVDDMRDIALHLMQSHYKHAVDQKRVGRVEFLPISWHASLHQGSFGMDRRMQNITLPSIPKLRYFANDTVLDILFYTSPVYCQFIVDVVGNELNKLYQLFVSRNPNFTGQVSVAGHSLGSLILFDILSHQPRQINEEEENVSSDDTVLENSTHMISLDPALEISSTSTLEEENIENGIQNKDSIEEESILETVFKKLGLEDYIAKFQEERLDLETLALCSEQDFKEMGLPLGPRKKLFTYLQLHEKEKEAKKVGESSGNVPDRPLLASASRLSVQSMSYTMGMDGTGQPSVSYPRLNFPLATFFALGSPIAVFLTVRGIEAISERYHLPTCPGFFNIFHPFDPVAYRIETLIDPSFNLKPVLIPHHKGRKRMHLQLKENLTRMGSDLKQKLMDSLTYTWNSISEFAKAHKFPTAQVEAEVEKIVEEEIKKNNDDEVESTVSASDNNTEEDIQIGKLNGGRRIDYVLQEKPIECLNEYVFALGSHTCYWESEDTVLMILRELYSLQGIYPLQQPYNRPSPVVPLYNPAISFQPTYHSTIPSGTMTVTSLPTDVEIQQPFQQHINSAPLMVHSQDIPSSSAPAPQSSVQVPLGPPPLTGFVKVSPIVKKPPVLTR